MLQQLHKYMKFVLYASAICAAALLSLFVAQQRQHTRSTSGDVGDMLGITAHADIPYAEAGYTGAPGDGGDGGGGAGDGGDDGDDDGT